MEITSSGFYHNSVSSRSCNQSKNKKTKDVQTEKENKFTYICIHVKYPNVEVESL